jgi:hypothetical protein
MIKGEPVGAYLAREMHEQGELPALVNPTGAMTLTWCLRCPRLAPSFFRRLECQKSLR